MTLRELLERTAVMLPRPNEFGLPGKAYKFGNRVVIGDTVYDARCLKEQKYRIEQFRKMHPGVHTFAPLEVSYNSCVIGKMSKSEKCRVNKRGVIVCTKESHWGGHNQNPRYTIQSNTKRSSSRFEKTNTTSNVSVNRDSNHNVSSANKSDIMQVITDKKFLLGAGLVALVVIALNK